MTHASQRDFEQAVLDVLRSQCGIEGKINLDSSLQGDLGLDSVGMLTLTVELEDRFQLILEDQVDPPPQTVRDVVRMVSRAVADDRRARGSVTPEPPSIQDDAGGADEGAPEGPALDGEEAQE